MIFWGEDPLQAEDIPLLSPDLINGEVYSPAYNKAFRARGIRQMIYTNSQPDDPLFPFYYVLSPKEQLHPRAGMEERAMRVFNEISFTSAHKGSGDHGRRTSMPGATLARIRKLSGWVTPWVPRQPGTLVHLTLRNSHTASTGYFTARERSRWVDSIG